MQSCKQINSPFFLVIGERSPEEIDDYGTLN